MTETEKQELSIVIQSAVKAGVHEELGAYKIPKEQHSKDHEWIRSTQSWVDNKIKWIDSMQDNFWKSVISTLVVGTIGLIVLGIILWGKMHIK